MVQRLASLQAEGFPSLSHARTFHQQAWYEASRLPSYSTWTERSEATRPLSHKSARSCPRTSGELATSTW